MIVVDANVLVSALADDGEGGDRARGRLRGQVLVAPELIDIEVPSVLRRLVRSGHLPVRRAEQALSDLVVLPLRRAPHRALVSRCWRLRDNQVDAVLVTADGRLSRAPGLCCEVDVLARPQANGD